MKKLNQKQWGILGTSLGSLLIIVALLTMVGIGSNDTYAATTTSCTCPAGYTHKPNTSICTKTLTESYSCCSGASCESFMGISSCSTTEGCTLKNSKEVGYGQTKHMVYEYSCSKATTANATCACPSGTTSNSSGQCVASSSSSSGTGMTTCSPGQYYAGQGKCASCPSGSYCPGGNFVTSSSNISGGAKCPDDKPYSEPNSSSISDCKASTGGESLSCPAGEYRAAGDCVTCPQGSYCPGGSDSTRHDCPADKPKSKAGSTSRIDCVASDSNPNRITCEAGTYYTGATKKCETCLSGYYCPGTSLPANTTLQGTDGIFKCPTDRPYSSSGAKLETDCLANGNGSAGGSGSSGGGTGGSGGSGGGGSTGGNTGGSTGGNSGGSTGGSTGGNTGGNNSNTNTNPNTATKTPLAIALIGMLAIGVGTVTYYKGKNNEI